MCKVTGGYWNDRFYCDKTINTDKNQKGDARKTCFTKFLIFLLLGHLVMYYLLGTSSIMVRLFTGRDNSSETHDSNKTTADSTTIIRAPKLPTGLFWPVCPAVSLGLVGQIPVNETVPSSEDELKSQFNQFGGVGHGKPESCVARHHTAIIVPYRGREAQLLVYLQHMVPFLRKQQLEYRIFIIEQVGNQTFNRGKLLNVGYAEAERFASENYFDCFVFHDVDLLPENDMNLYTCADQPRHLSVLVDKLNYRLPYAAIFGGAVALRKEHLLKVNGYSNGYWGWGAEDDDMSLRLRRNGYKLTRYPEQIARYKMIKHKREKLNPTNNCRFQMMYRNQKHWHVDGLNNLRYKLIQTDVRELYIKLTVDLLEKLQNSRKIKQIFTANNNCTIQSEVRYWKRMNGQADNIPQGY